MKRPLYLLLIVFITAALRSSAQNEVWSTDIAPILYNNCVSCHRSGGIAPFSLMTYQNAVAQKTAIKIDVQGRIMPPWPPDPKYSRLAHERLLSQQDINKIVNWVNNGTPQGDPNLAPPQPVFNDNGELPGTPDLTIKIPDYISTAVNGDEYRCFVIPSGLLADKYITSYEVIPGNRSIVHHVLVYADTTNICAQLDQQDPGIGYSHFGGVGNDQAIMIGTWVPGSRPITYPNNFGVQIPHNSNIVIQVHYPSGSGGILDSTKVRFYFSPAPVRNIIIAPILNNISTIVNGPIFIPANTTRTFTEQFTIPAPYTLSFLGAMPHMHLLGKTIVSYAVTATSDTIPFVRINDWEFHWQGFYMFRKLLKVPGGSTLIGHAFYDNTTNNHHNPNVPPQDVSQGEASKDEMMTVFLMLTFYQAGDENISIDSTTPADLNVGTTYYRGQQLLQPYPNPAQNLLYAKLHLDKADAGTMQLVDMQGRVVRTFWKDLKLSSGYTVYSLDIKDLAAGNYLLQLTTSERVLTQKVIKE